MASLPSISPEWMPFWIRTIGLPVRARRSGVNARPRDTIMSGQVASLPLSPYIVSLIHGDAGASRRQWRMVSS